MGESCQLHRHMPDVHRQPFEDGEHFHNQIESSENEDKGLHPDGLLTKGSISPNAPMEETTDDIHRIKILWWVYQQIQGTKEYGTRVFISLQLAHDASRTVLITLRAKAWS